MRRLFPQRLRQIPPIAFPMILLGIEILGLTPFVEFRAGPIAYLANANLLQTAMLGLVIYLSLREPIVDDRDTADGEKKPSPSYVMWGAIWFAIHIVLYLSFAALTVWWSDAHVAHQDERLQWRVPLAWGVLAWGVAFSACRMVFPRDRFLKELAPQWQAVVPALVCMGLYAGYLWYRKEIWQYSFKPMMFLATWIIVQIQGAGLLVIADDGLPIFGHPPVLLKVTANCNGLEAIAMFWLWWGAIAYSRWDKEGFFGGWITRWFVGTIALWLLNTLRIDVLIWLGQWKGAGLSVSMAHSQWWAIGALCLSGVILLWGRRKGVEHSVVEES